MDKIKVYKKEFLNSDYYIITTMLDGKEDNESVCGTHYSHSYSTELVSLLEAINEVLKSWDGTEVDMHYDYEDHDCECCGWFQDDTYTFTYKNRTLFDFFFDGHFGHSRTPDIKDIEKAYKGIVGIELDLSEF